MDYREIEFINSRSPVFRFGIVEFETSVKAELYEALRIFDWKTSVITHQDINDMVLNPTPEKLQKIIDIKDVIQIERIRGAVIGYVNDGNYDISNRVVDVVTRRFNELNSFVRNSSIVLDKTPVSQNNASAKEVDDLKKQIEEMKQMLAEKLNSVDATHISSVAESATNEINALEKAETKRRGRPKKTT